MRNEERGKITSSFDAMSRWVSEPISVGICEATP